MREAGRTESGSIMPLKTQRLIMKNESVETIKQNVLTQLHDAGKEGRKPELIKASPENYHLFLVAFMHQLRISEKGVELFGIPLVIEQDIAEITVILN
jgi:hypothetical protein